MSAIAPERRPIDESAALAVLAIAATAGALIVGIGIAPRRREIHALD
jgi:hypothetical protein